MEGSAPAAEAPPRILNVDDNPARLYVKSKILRKAGYEAMEASSGGSALALVNEARPDLVLLDVKLPDVDGFEVCRRIKEDAHTRHVPVLHISALRTADLDEASGLQSGADYYLCEPVQEEALLAVIKTLLMRAQWQQEREKLLRETQLARQDAERANRAKDAFLSVLSHELRDPLSVLSSCVAMLRKGGLGETELQHAYGIMERNIQTQTRLVDDLLDVARIESGKMLLCPAVVSIDAVLRAALEDTRLAAELKRITIEYDCHVPATIVADGPRVEQVVRNLLSNAVKFTPPGGRVGVSCRQDSGRMRIEVADTGAGIDPEVAAHIFEPYFQGGAGVRQHGLGLGLAIAAYIVKEHNGTITVRSDGPGKGSVFVVTLPMNPRTEKAA